MVYSGEELATFG